MKKLLPALLAALGMLLAGPSPAQTPISVVPSATDPAINTFTTGTQQHICFNPVAAPRNELLVFLPGSTGSPNGNDYFDQLAANLGYHVIGLMYPNGTAIGALCDASTDPDCYEKTRLEVIDGTDRTSLVSVDRANSIENRLIKCLRYLERSYPTQSWGQYLDAGNNIQWAKIAIGGHSQGGGHAALMAQQHRVARVLCLASPKDNYRTPTPANPQYLGIIAPWINQLNLTPKERYFTFTHVADATGATPAEQQIIFTRLGLRQLADSISVDHNAPPYRQSRILMTYRATANGAPIQPHNCVLVDNGVPDIFSTGINRFQPAWTYMLTQPTTTVTSTPTALPGLRLTVYPNPAHDRLFVQVPGGLPAEVRAYSPTGQLVAAATLRAGEALPITGWPAGIYYVRVAVAGAAPSYHKVQVQP